MADELVKITDFAQLTTIPDNAVIYIVAGGLDYFGTKADFLNGVAKFKGKFLTEAALVAAWPTATPGDSAQVNEVGATEVVNYSWDDEAGAWVAGGAPGSGATDTDSLAEGSTNLYHTSARVLAVLLSGLSLVTGGAIVSTDSVLVAFGKIQKQINDIIALFSPSVTNIGTGSTYTLVVGDKTIYSTAGNANVTITIPANATAAIPIGHSIKILRFNGAVDGNTATYQGFTISPASGVTIDSQNGLVSSGNASVELIKTGTNRWFVNIEKWQYGTYGGVHTAEYVKTLYNFYAYGYMQSNGGYNDLYNSVTFAPVYDTKWVTNKMIEEVTDQSANYTSTALVNKTYVDSLIQGLKVKAPVKAATTANITLSGTQTVDGVALVADDRCLVKDQSTQSQNGIYLVKSGSWVRATDADTATELTGAIVSVLLGTANAEATFRQLTTSITLGSSNIVFDSFGVEVPDATSSTKGKAKLYNDLSAGNTDGGVDQATVKALADKFKSGTVAVNAGVGQDTFTVTLPVAYGDANYEVVITPKNDMAASEKFKVPDVSKTASGFDVVFLHLLTGDVEFGWISNHN